MSGVLGWAALLALGLELLAVPLPVWGRFSSAPAVLLAGVLAPGVGPLAAVTLGLAVALVRLLRGGRGDAAADLLPVLAAALVVRPAGSLAWILAPTLFLGLWLRLHGLFLPRRIAGPERVAQARIERTLVEVRGTLTLAALPLAQAMTGSGWELAFGPLLLLAHRAAENAAFRVQAKAAHAARMQFAEAQRSLDELGRQKDRAERELSASREERQQLDALSRALAERPDLAGVAETLVESVAARIPCRSLVVFCDGRPVRYRSPEGERLEGAPLLQLGEPLVEDCLREGRALARAGQLLETETAALALPLAGTAALYVGRQAPFTGRELRWLSWVAERAAPIMTAALQKLRLDEEQRLRGQLHQQVSWLAAVVEASRQLADSVDGRAILESLGALLQKIVPQQAGRIFWNPGRLGLEWGNLDVPERALQEMVTVLRDYGKPLLIPDLTASRWPGASGSFLGVPLANERGPQGYVLLRHPDQDVWSRDQQDLVWMVGNQAAVALAKATLFQALRESQQQLVQSTKLMAIGQLAAGVAHELNTPLGTISLMVEGALQQLRTQPEAAERKLERARSGLTSSQAIVDRLLSYSRRSAAEPEPLDLTRIVKDAVDFLEPRWRAQGMTVEMAMEPCPVRGKPQELQQILVNLLLNAFQACQGQSAERKRVTIRTAARDSQAVLEVEDRGEGIPPEILARVFEPFYTTRPPGEGTGLGLSISQQLAEEHGGRLEVISQTGQGEDPPHGSPLDSGTHTRTCFRLFLPLSPP